MVEDEAKKKSSSETRANLFLSREETLVGSILPWQLQHNIFLLEMLRISNVIFLKEIFFV
jgi:hypothetical protein